MAAVTGRFPLPSLAALEPAPAGWRTAQGASGWCAARFVSRGPLLTPGIAWVTAPTPNALRAAIARREAELAITAEGAAT